MLLLRPAITSEPCSPRRVVSGMRDTAWLVCPTRQAREVEQFLAPLSWRSPLLREGFLHQPPGPQEAPAYCHRDRRVGCHQEPPQNWTCQLGVAIRDRACPCSNSTC